MSLSHSLLFSLSLSKISMCHVAHYVQSSYLLIKWIINAIINVSLLMCSSVYESFLSLWFINVLSQTSQLILAKKAAI